MKYTCLVQGELTMMHVDPAIDRTQFLEMSRCYQCGSSLIRHLMMSLSAWFPFKRKTLYLLPRPAPPLSRFDLAPLNRSTLYVRVGPKGGLHATSASHRMYTHTNRYRRLLEEW